MQPVALSAAWLILFSLDPVRVVAIFTAVAVVIFVLAWDTVEFADGYSGFPSSLLLLLFGLAVLSSCSAIVVALVAAVRGRWRQAVVIVLVLCFAWASSPWFLARSVFLRGFALRLRRIATPAEIESASQRCLSLLPHGGRVYGPKKIMGPAPEEEQQSKRAWDALATYRFVHLANDTCVIFVEPTEVSFTWGGALPGHWGIRVVGSHASTTPSEDFQSLRFSDTIILFRGE